GHFVVSPIIGIHLWFDPRTVRMDLPHLVLMESPLQWVFNKGLERQPENAAQDASPPSSKSQASSLHLHGVISAAHDLVDEPAEAIIDMAVREVRRSLPGNGGADAKLLHARVIKEKRATFSAGPGIDAMRPEARGAIPNLYLAGDWCRTGWP